MSITVWIVLGLGATPLSGPGTRGGDGRSFVDGKRVPLELTRRERRGSDSGVPAAFQGRVRAVTTAAFAGSMSFQGGVIGWVHRYGTSLAGQLRGLAHAHTGWLLRDDPTPPERYAPDMTAARRTCGRSPLCRSGRAGTTCTTPIPPAHGMARNPARSTFPPR